MQISISRSALRRYRKEHALPSNFAPHLKHIRRKTGHTVTLLIGQAANVSEDFRTLIAEVPGVTSEPYLVDVPTRSAVNKEQLTLFSELWPVTFTPIRIGSDAQLAPKGWKPEYLKWVTCMLERVYTLACQGKEKGELPIASLVTRDRLGPVLAEACDTRCSTQNFLCHSAANVIHHVAALDAVDSRKVEGLPAPYLLSGLHFFTTHEPCIMCSMAILHSRVAAVYFIKDSPQSGGMGSLYSVHEDRGLNHKFQVWQWSGSLCDQLQRVDADP